jgi:siroheme synthase-like protein
VLSDDAPAVPYYPVFLDLREKLVVVIGGGKIARHKVEGLLDAGARVQVVAPAGVPMPDEVPVLRERFRPAHLDGAMLVVAATDDPAVNDAVARAAAERHIFINAVDDPARCTMILPAVVRRGALRIAVSTGGGSPLLAGRLRRELERIFGPEYGDLVDLLRRLRGRWDPLATAAGLCGDDRRAVWERVLDLPLLDLLRSGDANAAEQRAGDVLLAAIDSAAGKGADATTGA